MENHLPADVPNLAFIVEERIHDQLLNFEAATENLMAFQVALNEARMRFFGLGALLFAEETRIPIVTERDIDFIEEWGPNFGWNGVAFYPEPNNINVINGLEFDEINELAANHVDLWTQAGNHEEAIQRAHNRLQQFEDAWQPFVVAMQAIEPPSAAHRIAAAPLVKATIIPVVTGTHMILAKDLRNQFGWAGNAMYPRNNDIRQFYGAMTQAEGNHRENLLAERANIIRFRSFVHR